MKGKGRGHKTRDFCRICLVTGSTVNPLIQPCNCVADLAYCHSSCLSKWISTTRSIRCDLCRFAFITSIETFSFFDWLSSDEDELKQFLGGIFILFLSFYMVLLGEVTCSSIQDSDGITGILLFLITLTSELGYIGWIAFFTHITANRFFSWSENHVKVSVFAYKRKSCLVKPRQEPISAQNPKHGEAKISKPPSKPIELSSSKAQKSDNPNNQQTKSTVTEVSRTKEPSGNRKPIKNTNVIYDRRKKRDDHRGTVWGFKVAR
ncbi:E3 ubiquitin-protein ligase MARCHF3-like [Panonychus citri]|uniref:E3 ubiquitin-protein ligase MARCHF3-like n=1 Tax=Panonychus citri TaxID=50023 RepID=UPI0023081EDC|nr:E3 ubiquitin-protein ligase MARCHF3-like [Panonychus citri]